MLDRYASLIAIANFYRNLKHLLFAQKLIKINFVYS